MMVTSGGPTLFDSFGWDCKKFGFFFSYKVKYSNYLDFAIFLLTLFDSDCVLGHPTGSTSGFQFCPLIVYTGSKNKALKRIRCLM